MLVIERVHAKRSWKGEGEEEMFVVESRHMTYLRMIEGEGRR